MKKLMVYGFLIILVSFTSSCSNTDTPPTEMSVEQLREEIRKKNAETRSLTAEIEELQNILEDKDPDFQKEVFNVTIDTLGLSDFIHYTAIQGEVKSSKEVSISAETGGRVLDLRVEEGDYVRKGQLIAILDVESTDAQIREVESQYNLAVELYEKQKALWDQEIGSEVQYLQAKNNKENLEKSLESLRINQSKSQVYATASGTVETIAVEQGEFAAVGAPIVTLLDVNNLKVIAQVPEVYIKHLKVGNEVKVDFPILKTSQTAVLSRVGSVINQANRTIEIEAKIKLDEGRLIKPNMLTMVYIKDFEKKDIIKLPIPLVQQEVSSRKYVLVAEKEGKTYKAVKKAVKTGPYYNNEVLIEEGLKEGDFIIHTGARGLAAGSILNVLSEKEAAQLLSHTGTEVIDG